MTRYDLVLEEIVEKPRTWLVTGAAGFIGSHLVERLLTARQRVVGLDNFATGFRHNLDEIKDRVGSDVWANFSFTDGDIRDLQTCQNVCRGVDFVLHQAALGSVPRSIEDPIATHATNLSGFLNILVAARDADVRRFVYAASSSTYGDSTALPKVESRIGRPLSPYAVTKYANELYAQVFAETYAIQTVGLRYFNVFGARQDPNGAYAAVIPRWIGNLLNGRPCVIYGDGNTTRDFSHISNVVQANLLAALTDDLTVPVVYNVGCGGRTSLNDLFELIRAGLALRFPDVESMTVEHVEFRSGDIRHSEADISKIQNELGYQVSLTVREGLAESLEWYVDTLSNNPAVLP